MIRVKVYYDIEEGFLSVNTKRNRFQSDLEEFLLNQRIFISEENPEINVMFVPSQIIHYAYIHIDIFVDTKKSYSTQYFEKLANDICVLTKHKTVNTIYVDVSVSDNNHIVSAIKK